MKKRLIIFWNTIRAIWSTFSKPARLLMILGVLFLAAMPIFSSQRGVWILLCGVMSVFGAVAAYILYRLLLK